MGADPTVWGVREHAAEIEDERAEGRKLFWLPRRREAPTFVSVFGRDIHYQDGGRFRETDLRFEPDGLGGFEATRGARIFRVGSQGVQVGDRASGQGVRWRTPVEPTVTERGCNLLAGQLDGTVWAGLDLRWTIRKRGLKLDIRVAGRQGARVIRFRYVPVGSFQPFTLVDGVPRSGDIGLLPPAVVGDDGQEIEGIVSWAVTAEDEVALVLDDSAVPAAAFPYVIDPTTSFAILASGDDGSLQGGGTVYPGSFTSLSTTATVLEARRRFTSPNYAINVAVMRWDTSILDDSASITSAEFSFHVDNVDDDDNRSFEIEWYDFGASIDSADWTATSSNTAHAGTDLTTLNSGLPALKTFACQNLGSISKTGNTGARAHVSGGAPTAQNRVHWGSFDHVTYQEPRLLVTYAAAPDNVSRVFLGAT